VPNRRRLLIYSHDSFGLGHLRRCRSIALSLVRRMPDLEVLILSGLPIITEYQFDERVSCRLVPGIIKMRDGDYKAVGNETDIRGAIEARSRMILDTARDFDPHLFLVDKEPLGVRGEVTATLDYLKSRKVPVVLGIRDVMDDPSILAAEWERKQALPALERYYSEVWVYGLECIYQPLQGLPLSDGLNQRLIYTSYLRRARDKNPDSSPLPVEKPYLLVTPGGGGDGEALVDWVLSAAELQPLADHRILIVCGPFMDTASRTSFEVRARKLEGVEIITFSSRMERLLGDAAGVVAMGGYNTFCEILSFDLPALVVPRTQPRREQFIRASEAEKQGLLKMLPDDGVRDPAAMADALAALCHQAKPSQVTIPGLLDGHDRIAERVAALVAAPVLLSAAV
jgi:predicted glycosyltransferase